MSGRNPNWNEFVHNVANDISDIVGGSNKLVLRNFFAERDIYEFNIRCKDSSFALRFAAGQDGQSLEFIADSNTPQNLPEPARSAYQKIVEYAKDSKNTNIKARFEYKYAAFLGKLEDNLKSMFGAEIVRRGSAFMIGNSTDAIAEVYSYNHNQVRIFVRDERVLEQIHIIADAYKPEFHLECSKSQIAAQKWQAKAREQQAQST